MDLRREYIFDVFEKRMKNGDVDFVCDYSTAMLACYPDSAGLMNWNAASRTERVVRDKDGAALPDLIRDLREYAQHTDSAVIKKYLQLAELMKKNIDGAM